jgi:hypothetical protein
MKQPYEKPKMVTQKVDIGTLIAGVSGNEGYEEEP